MACISNVEVGSGKNYDLKITARKSAFRILRTPLYSVEWQWDTMPCNKGFETKIQSHKKKKKFGVSYTKSDV